MDKTVASAIAMFCGKPRRSLYVETRYWLKESIVWMCAETISAAKAAFASPSLAKRATMRVFISNAALVVNVNTSNSLGLSPISGSAINR